MTFAFIEAEKASSPSHRMGRTLNVSQGGFFAWRDRPACQRQRHDIIQRLPPTPVPLDTLRAVHERSLQIEQATS